MVRRLATGTAALAVLVVAGALLLPRSETTFPGGRPLAAQSSISPRAALFGDRVTAEVDVVYDRRSAGQVRVATDFSPYAVVSRSREALATGGGTELRLRYELDCLARECLPKSISRRFVFAPAQVSYRRPAGGTGSASVVFAPLIVDTRVGAADLARPQLRSTFRLGDPTLRVRPGLAAALLGLVAAMLFVLAALLALPQLRSLRIRLVRRRDPLARLAPLDRALALLRRAAETGDAAATRRALERLSRELDGELGDEARVLAWAETGPDAERIGALVVRVKENGA